MTDNLTRSFARWTRAPRTSQTPSQWANPFDLKQPDDEPREAHPIRWLLAALALGFVAGYLFGVGHLSRVGAYLFP